VVGHVGSPTCIVNADVSLTRSKVKVKVTGLLNSENCQKLHFFRPLSSAIFAWSSKLMLDCDSVACRSSIFEFSSHKAMA